MQALGICKVLLEKHLQDPIGNVVFVIRRAALAAVCCTLPVYSLLAIKYGLGHEHLWYTFVTDIFSVFGILCGTSDSLHLKIKGGSLSQLIY
jgi:hypothetical protein